MATASRSNSGAYDTLWTNATEDWLNDNGREDTVFLSTPALAVLTNNQHQKEMSNTVAVRLGNRRGAGVQAFAQFDTVNTNPTPGTQAAAFNVANYSGPIALSWQDKLELGVNATKIADHADYVMSTQVEEMREQLGADIYRGNVGDSKRILGFEQVLPDYTHDQTSGSAASSISHEITQRWQMKQATNNFGGIQRVAWTSSTPGTYFEGNSVDFFQQSFAFSSGALNDAMKRLENVAALSAYQGSKPDAMFSSYRPWQDYMNAAAEKQQITRGSGMISANVSFDNVMYKGKTWFWDDFCKTYVADSAATVDSDNIYLIDTKKTYLCADSRANFTVTEERTPVNQHASVKHLLWRGQLVCLNPRTNARIFDYGS